MRDRVVGVVVDDEAIAVLVADSAESGGGGKRACGTAAPRGAKVFPCAEREFVSDFASDLSHRAELVAISFFRKQD